MTINQNLGFRSEIVEKLNSIIDYSLKNKIIYKKDYEYLKQYIGTIQGSHSNRGGIKTNIDWVKIVQSYKFGYTHELMNDLYYSHPESILRVSSFLKKVNFAIKKLSRTEAIDDLNLIKSGYEKLLPYEELLIKLKSYITKKPPANPGKININDPDQDLEKLKGQIRSTVDNIRIINEIKEVAEPMIEDLVKKEMINVRKITEDAMEWINKNNDFKDNNILINFKGVSEYLDLKRIKREGYYYTFLYRTIKNNKDILKKSLYSIYASYSSLIIPEDFEFKIWIDEPAFDKLEKQYREHYRLFLLSKLEQSITKYFIDVVEIADIKLEHAANGFVINAKITYKNGIVKKYQTTCIPAGGYNIQQFHYRYLTKIY